MNKKMLNIISALVLLLSFFMPWITFYGFGGSPYQVILEIFKNLKYVDDSPQILLSLLLLIFPVCAILILIYYNKKELKKEQLGTLQFAKKTPLIFLILVIFYGLIKLGDNAGQIFEVLTEVIGIGLILTIISAIVLFIDQTGTQSLTINSDGNSQNAKEEANTDDLFN